MKVDQIFIDQAAGLSTAEVSDALDYFGLPGSAPGIRPIAGPRKLCGPAFTVRFAPVDTAKPGTVGDYLDDIPAGAVAVLDNAGRIDCTVWGGIMSRLAARRGLGGTVVNGVCRDTAEADEAGYPLYAAGRFMRTGKDRVQVDAIGEPVTLAGVRVCAGDFVIADLDGVVVVPAARTEEVLRRALSMQAVEQRIVAAALDGMTLSDARRQFGYHTLQRKPG
ncbi:RraA family protein [Duganella sp. FT92W]|uniref:Putative 4-hydroxy-4-methyl-2-oxoglutarate aldolase n=1 Tax=Pseudoduganella rivuli TaxID=2666085 RepID=A0A7X2IPV9_9BURK|nr:RraA family protein [Pseudoduganella rivuli]MRV73783.1 RraA family protein [Pseudoduganella rivuli]